MGTEKKNRTPRDEETTTSVTSSGNNSADASASLAARRAKLRGALGSRAAASSPSPYSPENFASSYQQESGYQQDAGYQEDAGESSQYGSKIDNYIDGTSDAPVNVYGVPVQIESEIEAQPDPEPEPEPEPAPEPRPRIRKGSSLRNTSEFEAAPASQTGSPAKKEAEPEKPVVQVTDNTYELIYNIDQVLNVCATNLASLQNISGEQTEVMKGLSSTLQNQTLLEIGLNLNSLTESLTAALEPMKAIGELVPALDSLVSTLESREQTQTEKLSPDQLVTSLADQLSAGLIDPWTFKCAYMAVYPADHPADLLHRLVELLGSQRLSGDLFRAAYEAVQAAEPPQRQSTSIDYSSMPPGSIDESIRIQLDNLEKANAELQRRQEERENELMQILSQKDSALQEAHEQLNNRMEDLNNRYSEAAEMLAQREEEFRAAIESKDMDLIEKDAELNMLRAQMEELRSQTEDMVKDLQKEMLSLRENQMQSAASAGPQGASQDFFESQTQPARSGLFEAQPPKPAFAEAASSGFASADSSGFAPQETFNTQPTQSFQAAPPSPASTGFQAPPANQGFQAPPQPVFQAPQPAAPQPAAPQPAGPGPAPPTTAFASGGAQASGSYGMGVRQQVFEVIVRQALAGAPWREICAGPMSVNNIKPEEVEAEVQRRQSMLNK